MNQNTQLLRTDSTHDDFRKLVNELDADLAIRDGAEHAFFAQYNKIDNIKNVVVAYLQGIPVACGAIKEYEPGIAEVKRMYVVPAHRSRGIASLVLAELEQWSAELGYTANILETGEKQPEAVRLYHKNGYAVIPNYGQYANVESSICFMKSLK